MVLFSKAHSLHLVAVCVKVSDEALEVKDGNTLNKHLKCLEKQIRKLYSIWTNLCKNFQWFIWWSLEKSSNSHIQHLKCSSHMDVIKNNNICIQIEKHFWNFYLMESCWGILKLAYTAFEMCQLHGCKRAWWCFWWPLGF